MEWLSLRRDIQWPNGTRDQKHLSRLQELQTSLFWLRGGRHGYGTTPGKLQGGLAIDLSQLKAIEVDKAAGTVTVGAGVRIGDAMRPVYEAGYELPVGSCPHVGLIGATLGGGVGVFQGLFGLIIDSLLSVRLITANGNLVEASISSNPDLFWARFLHHFST
ncbi:hypothetical protein F4815DRAFT_503774 [Daldinia loculata]|nr:hypothetical protein F4815DRAFT_503774 [Daldinia loculata]